MVECGARLRTERVHTRHTAPRGGVGVASSEASSSHSSHVRDSLEFGSNFSIIITRRSGFRCNTTVRTQFRLWVLLRYCPGRKHGMRAPPYLCAGTLQSTREISRAWDRRQVVVEWSSSMAPLSHSLAAPCACRLHARNGRRRCRDGPLREHGGILWRQLALLVPICGCGETGQLVSGHARAAEGGDHLRSSPQGQAAD
jgi:hypothetical protein